MSLFLHRAGLLRPSAAAATEIAFLVSATSSNSSSITCPASVSSGDLFVLIDSVWNTGAAPPSSSVPTNFLQIATASLGGSASTRTTVSAKIATGTEASTAITGMSGTGGAAKALAVFRCDSIITSGIVGDIGSEATSGDPAAQVITASLGTPPLVVLGFYSSFTAIDPRSMTPAKDGEIQATGNSIDSYIAWKTYNAAPEDVTIDMDDEGLDNILISCFIQVS